MQFRVQAGCHIEAQSYSAHTAQAGKVHLYSQCRSTMKSGVEFGESVHSSISALFMMCAACLRTYVLCASLPEHEQTTV